MYRVAEEKAARFVDYTGNVKPQPLVRDALGDWVVREEEAVCGTVLDDLSFIGPNEASVEVGEGGYEAVVEKAEEQGGGYLPTR